MIGKILQTYGTFSTTKKVSPANFNVVLFSLYKKRSFHLCGLGLVVVLAQARMAPFVPAPTPAKSRRQGGRTKAGVGNGASWTWGKAEKRQNKLPCGLVQEKNGKELS